MLHDLEPGVFLLFSIVENVTNTNKKHTQSDRNHGQTLNHSNRRKYTILIRPCFPLSSTALLRVVGRERRATLLRLARELGAHTNISRHLPSALLSSGQGDRSEIQWPSGSSPLQVQPPVGCES